MSLLKLLQQQFITAVKFSFSAEILQIDVDLNDYLEVTEASSRKFGHYQSNIALKLAKLLNNNPREIALKIQNYLLQQQNNININNSNSVIFEKIEVAGPGFINITISNDYLSYLVMQYLIQPTNIINKPEKKLNVIIDFSSPNIAKEMHVGHLRSTIIGDCLARILEFLGHNVLRLNHIGDWGTQFGMLIAYLKKTKNNSLDLDLNFNIAYLLNMYKQSKQLFDQDESFKLQAQQEVVLLQQENSKSRAIWQKICEISRISYNEIYQLLDIKLIERGESFYQPLLNQLIEDLVAKNLITQSDGAKCVYLKGFINREGNPLPLIVQKSDGGYNYASTDMAALRQRVEQEHGEWLIYVTDSGQSQHFQMVFAACKEAGYYNSDKVRVDHVPLGLVLRSDGKKFKTREGDTERLIDLINTAISKAKYLLQQRQVDMDGTDGSEIENMARILGINAIKYADLSTNRVSDYIFNYDTMLQFEGNTAAFLLYAYVRIQSIKRKVKIDIKQLLSENVNIILQNIYEIELALHICQFSDSLEKCVQDLMPNRLTDYLYKLAEKFHAFFHHCRVEGSTAVVQASRLLLCQATANLLEYGFKLLGLKTLEKM